MNITTATTAACEKFALIVTDMELQVFILNDTIMEPFHLVLGINSKT